MSRLMVPFLLVLTGLGFAAEPEKSSSPMDILVVSGTITNVQRKPIKKVTLSFLVNGEKVHLEEEVTTSKAGRYEAELPLPRGTLPGAGVELEGTKPSYKASGRITLERIVEEKEDETGNAYFLAHHNFTMKRSVTPAFWIATLILAAVYALLAFELMHRTLAALLGGALILTGVNPSRWRIPLEYPRTRRLAGMPESDSLQ